MKHHFEHPSSKEKSRSMSEQLAHIFREKYPDLVEKNLHDLKNREQDIITIESELFNKDFLDNLARYDIDPTPISPYEKDGLYQIPVVSHFHEDRLPNGYAYKGGAARALLYRALGIDFDATPRDIDIVRLIPQEPYAGADYEIAQKYMPADLEYGDGVEEIDLDQGDYFQTRDLTINEILADDEKIIVSQKGLSDAVRHILRITDFEKEKAQVSFGHGLPHKIMAKTLRMYSEGIKKYGEERLRIDDEQKFAYEEYFITPFYLAVHLDRAFEQGHNVAEIFFQQLQRHRQIPNEISSAVDLAYYLNRLMNFSPFHYRHAPVDQYRLEEEWQQSLEEDGSFDEE